MRERKIAEDVLSELDLSDNEKRKNIKEIYEIIEKGVNFYVFFNEIDEKIIPVDFEKKIKNEKDEYKKNELIKMYFESIEQKNEMEKWNRKQQQEWRKKIFRRL